MSGQAYVALSRATSLEGLQVLNFNPSKARYSMYPLCILLTLPPRCLSMTESRTGAGAWRHSIFLSQSKTRMMISSSFENLLIGFLIHCYSPYRSVSLHSIALALTHTLFLACTVIHYDRYTYLGCNIGVICQWVTQLLLLSPSEASEAVTLREFP